MSVQGRNSDIAHYFNIWSPAKYFAHYLDSLVLEWFLDGMFTTIQIKDLVEASPDQTLISLVVYDKIEKTSRTKRRFSFNRNFGFDQLDQ